jgi:ribonuclease-3
VLGLVTSEFLYRENPEEHEGDLTKAKSLLVSKAILSRRALAMGLGRFVLMSHSEVESGGRQRLSILADAFEAVIGAVYLDQGFEPARAFIHRWLLSESGEIVADKRHTNYKSHLQEYVQSTWRTHPVYRIRSEMGPDHSKHFLVEVLVGKRSLGDGRGRNKKEAEQAAARNALERAGVSIGAEDVEAVVAETERPASRASSERQRMPDAPLAAAVIEDEDDEDVAYDRSRRRGRAGRDREARRPLPEAEPEAAAAPETPTAGRLAVPSNRLKPLPEPPAWSPAPPEKEPLPSPIEEDELDDVGRPEGPLEELHVDPYAWGAEPVAPQAELALRGESDEFETPAVAEEAAEDWEEAIASPAAAAEPAEGSPRGRRNRGSRRDPSRRGRTHEAGPRETARPERSHEPAPAADARDEARSAPPREIETFELPREPAPFHVEREPDRGSEADSERESAREAPPPSPEARPAPASFGRRRSRR